MGVFKDDPASMRKILSNALSGWNYWYNWSIILPAELSAAATLMHFWVDKKFDPLWIIMCFSVVFAINMLGAGKSDHKKHR